MKDGWAAIIEACLNWLRDTFPKLFSVGIVVYDFMNARINGLKAKIAMQDLELKHEKNKDKVEADAAGKSDADVLKDAASTGSKLPD